MVLNYKLIYGRPAVPITPLQLSLNHLLEAHEAPIIQEFPINKNSGYSPNAYLLTVLHIPDYQFPYSWVPHPL